MNEILKYFPLKIQEELNKYDLSSLEEIRIRNRKTNIFKKWARRIKNELFNKYRKYFRDITKSL